VHRKSRKPLNILVLDNCEYPLTYGYMQELFGRAFVRRGHKVTWLQLTSEPCRKGEIRKMGRTEVVLSPLVSGRGRISTMQNYFYYKQRLGKMIPALIRSRSINLVFVRNHVRIGALAAKACKDAGIPFVYYLGYPTLESHRLSARLGYRRPRFLAELAALYGIPLRNKVTRNADFVYAMSDYWAGKVTGELGVPSGKVDSLPAGFDSTIDLTTLDGAKIREKFGIGSLPMIFYMGTISPPRDALILANILKLVVDKVPDVRLLLLYGHGEEKHLPRLRARFAGNGVEDNVVFAPSIPYKDIPDYLAAADLGLSPIETIPLYNVSSPYKFTEMLGMQCPVVASNTPEQKAILERSGGGVSVPYEAGAFADAIVDLLSDPAKCKEMGLKGRAYVEKERSYIALAEKLEKCFYGLLSE